MSWKEEDIDFVPKGLEDFEDTEIVRQLVREYNFELAFYKAVAGTDNFEIIPYPDETGHYLDSIQLKSLIRNYKKDNKSILIRVSHGKFATVYDEKTQKVGVMPEQDHDGFSC